MEGKELQVELGEGEAGLSGVVFRGDHVLVPQHRLGGVQGHLVDRLALREAALVGCDHDVLQELASVGWC